MLGTILNIIEGEWQGKTYKIAEAKKKTTDRLKMYKINSKISWAQKLAGHVVRMIGPKCGVDGSIRELNNPMEWP